MLIVVRFLLWHMAWHGSDTNENAVFIIIITRRKKSFVLSSSNKNNEVLQNNKLFICNV